MKYQMTKAKRFLLGFIALFSLIVFNSLIRILNKKELNLQLIIISIIIFFVTSFAILLWEKLVKPRLIQIFKIICSIFIMIICITDFSFFEQSILFIISIFIPFAISLIPLSPKRVQNLQETSQEQLNKKSWVSYLFNYLILFLFYCFITLYYYTKQIDKNEFCTLIILYAVGLSIIFWGAYLIYRFILKNNKVSCIIRIVIIAISFLMLIFYLFSIKQYPFRILLLVDIVGLISVTLQNIILDRMGMVK